MPNTERLLLSHPDASWLPNGGRADVVLVGADAVVPNPTCIVRLLITRGKEILTEARADGGGPDIPSLRVCSGTVEENMEALLVRVLGAVYPATLLGYVRNVVHEAPDDYPWPSPVAHFAVWRCTYTGDLGAHGLWLDAAEAEAELGNRHWWPLAAHLRRETA